MRYLLDTNVLLRFVVSTDPDHSLVTQAVTTLLQRGDSVCVSPQVIREFWHVCTRSREANGLALPPETVAELVGEVLADFDLIEDEAGTFGIWLRLVTDLSISGARVHDANHAALALANQIDFIVTMDPDLAKLTALGVRAVHPSRI